MPEPGKCPTGRVRVWLLSFAIAAMAVGASAPSAAAVPSNFWGVISQGQPSMAEFQRLKAGGVDSIRVPVAWSLVQPVEGGPLNWSTVDPMFAGATAAGLEVLPFAYGAPSWAVPVDRRWGSPRNLPVRSGKQRAAWQAFLTQVVLRYGPNGSFWAENPALPPRPVRIWQVWNEENFKYFVARPNPVEYGKLVKLSYAAIKAVDPGARIMLGGMFSRPKEANFKAKPAQAYFAADFLEQMYASTPGIKSKFHGVALHPYTSTYTRLKSYVEEFRAVLTANRDVGKSLWITELGWSSQRPEPGNSFAKGVRGQEKQLKGAFGVLRANQSKWRLRQVYWFSVNDAPGACNFCDGSGLFGAGFVPKPAWYAYVKFAGGQPG